MTPDVSAVVGVGVREGGAGGGVECHLIFMNSGKTHSWSFEFVVNLA